MKLVTHFNYLGSKLGFALREVVREGYTLRHFKSDLGAGLIVGLVAIPLAMALAVASGTPPQYGLYTVIIAGLIIAPLGGSRLQISGPTAAFVVVLAPIVHKFGMGGLLLSGFMAGVILIIMGFAGLGKLIQYIPYPVTTGFTSGIAVVIASIQIKDFFGLQVTHLPDKFLERLLALAHSWTTLSLIEALVGLSTLFILIIWPRVNHKIPAPLAALFLVSVGTALLNYFQPNITIATIGNSFTFNINGHIGQGIPQVLPDLRWPWEYVGSDGRLFPFNFATLEAILPSAFAIALLGAIESLLSAVIADGMTYTQHDPDAELLALGIGNMICPFFGGVPATGAIARTATNARFGGRSPVSAIVHGLFVLSVVLSFAPLLSYLPMAALAALLLLVAYNMSERAHFIHILKVAPRSDRLVLLLCFLLTVLFDMVVGVVGGVVIASLLFMRRMAAFTESSEVARHSLKRLSRRPFPKDVVVYEIEGPLFFGAAQKASHTLTHIADRVRAVIFCMQHVPTMDMTGLVALESAIHRLRQRHCQVYLVSLNEQPRKLIQRSDLASQPHVHIAATVDAALNQIANLKSL